MVFTKLYGCECRNTKCPCCTGNPITIPAPTVSTTYWAQYQGTLGCQSSCKSINVTVNPSPSNPTSASTSNNNYCSGLSTNISLSVTGGNGTTFGWYTGGCRGILIGSANPLSYPAPTTTTTYWVDNIIHPVIASVV